MKIKKKFCVKKRYVFSILLGILMASMFLAGCETMGELFGAYSRGMYEEGRKAD